MVVEHGRDLWEVAHGLEIRSNITQRRMREYGVEGACVSRQWSVRAGGWGATANLESLKNRPWAHVTHWNRGLDVAER